MPDALPDALVELSKPRPPGMASTACRLDRDTLQRLDALRSRLGCKRGPLTRALVGIGLDAVERQEKAGVEVIVHG